MLHTCGIQVVPHLQYLIHYEGLINPASLLLINEKYIRSISERCRATTFQNPFVLGIVTQKRIAAFRLWINDLQRIGVPPNTLSAAAFNEEAILFYSKKIGQVIDHTKNQIAIPEKFKPGGWDEWSISMSEYFRSQIGYNGTNLTYFLRNDDLKPTLFNRLTMEQRAH